MNQIFIIFSASFGDRPYRYLYLDAIQYNF